jgi:putative DNA primase/helicase
MHVIEPDVGENVAPSASTSNGPHVETEKEKARRVRNEAAIAKAEATKDAAEATKARALVSKQAAAARKTKLDEQQAKKERTKTSLRLVAEGESGPAPRFSNLTDTGNAERFAKMHRPRARFVAAWNEWIAYDGHRWARDPGRVRVGAMAKAAVRAIYGEAAKATDPELRAALVRWGEKSEAAAARSNMIDLARSEPGMSVDYMRLDADPWLFNCANGTLHLKTGEFRPQRADDLLMKMSQVRYNPSAQCPRFQKFLEEIMGGDVALIELLERSLGYALTGDVSEHVVFFWHGEEGGNGKSTLSETVLKIMGDYGAKAAPDLLFKGERTERHPCEIADLFGVRFLVCNETDGKRPWDEPTVKDLTGGDQLKARRMRENFWPFNPTHTIVVYGNKKPRLKNPDDGGMRRRMRLVPFVVSFSGNPDRTLGAELAKEAPGILSLLVRGCLKWQGKIEGYDAGLTDPPAAVAATAGYFAEEDIIGRFFSDRCTFEPTAKIARKTLRAALIEWTEEAGERMPDAKALATSLQKRGVTEKSVRTEKGPRDGWLGVRLRELMDEPEEEEGGQCKLTP